MSRKHVNEFRPTKIDFVGILQDEHGFSEEIVGLFKELEDLHKNIGEKLYGDAKQGSLEAGDIAATLILGKLVLSLNDEELADWLKQEIERMKTFL